MGLVLTVLIAACGGGGGDCAPPLSQPGLPQVQFSVAAQEALESNGAINIAVTFDRAAGSDVLVDHTIGRSSSTASSGSPRSTR